MRVLWQIAYCFNIGIIGIITIILPINFYLVKIRLRHTNVEVVDQGRGQPRRGVRRLRPPRLLRKEKFPFMYIMEYSLH